MDAWMLRTKYDPDGSLASHASVFINTPSQPTSRFARVAAPTIMYPQMAITRQSKNTTRTISVLRRSGAPV